MVQGQKMYTHQLCSEVSFKGFHILMNWASEVMKNYPCNPTRALSLPSQHLSVVVFNIYAKAWCILIVFGFDSKLQQISSWHTPLPMILEPKHKDSHRFAFKSEVTLQMHTHTCRGCARGVCVPAFQHPCVHTHHFRLGMPYSCALAECKILKMTGLIKV